MTRFSRVEDLRVSIFMLFFPKIVPPSAGGCCGPVPRVSCSAFDRTPAATWCSESSDQRSYASTSLKRPMPRVLPHFPDACIPVKFPRKPLFSVHPQRLSGDTKQGLVDAEVKTYKLRGCLPVRFLMDFQPPSIM